MLASTPERAYLDAAARAVLLTAALTVPVAYLLAGTPGALGAVAALAFLVLLFGVSALLHVLAAGHGRHVWLALTVGGLGLRLVLYVVLVRTLGGIGGLNGTALGLAAATGIVVGQVLEVRALTRARAREIARPPARADIARMAAGGGLEGVER